MIFADSPEAKERIERTFRTIQDRLIPVLRLKKITDLKTANIYLKKEFIGKYWKSKNVIKAYVPEIAYSPLDPWQKLNQILCVEEDCKMGSEQTVSYYFIEIISIYRRAACFNHLILANLTIEYYLIRCINFLIKKQGMIIFTRINFVFWS